MGIQPFMESHVKIQTKQTWDFGWIYIYIGWAAESTLKRFWQSFMAILDVCNTCSKNPRDSLDVVGTWEMIIDLSVELEVPSGKHTIIEAIESGPVEIVDLPMIYPAIKWWIFCHSYVTVYQRLRRFDTVPSPPDVAFFSASPGFWHIRYPKDIQKIFQIMSQYIYFYMMI